MTHLYRVLLHRGYLHVPMYHLCMWLWKVHQLLALASLFPGQWIVTMVGTLWQHLKYIFKYFITNKGFMVDWIIIFLKTYFVKLCKTRISFSMQYKITFIFNRITNYFDLFFGFNKFNRIFWTAVIFAVRTTFTIFFFGNELDIIITITMDFTFFLLSWRKSLWSYTLSTAIPFPLIGCSIFFTNPFLYNFLITVMAIWLLVWTFSWTIISICFVCTTGFIIYFNGFFYFIIGTRYRRFLF